MINNDMLHLVFVVEDLWAPQHEDVTAVGWPVGQGKGFGEHQLPAR